MYKLEDEGEKEVEREYLFRSNGDYDEIGTYKVLTLEKFCPLAQFEGRVNGVWLCIYLFDSDRHCPPNLEDMPTVLSILRYPTSNSPPLLFYAFLYLFSLLVCDDIFLILEVPYSCFYLVCVYIHT